MRLMTFIKKTHKSPLFKNFMTLASSSTLAQIITLSVMPIFTRLYTPTEFGIFALFIAVVSTFTAAICGRYDLAIVVAKSEREAKTLLVIALQISILICALLMVAAILFVGPIRLYFHLESLGWWLYAVPIAILISANSNALKNYANFHERYKKIGRANIFQAISIAFFTLIFGAIDLMYGLLFGLCFGIIFTFFYLIFCDECYKIYSKRCFLVNKYLIDTAKKFKDYPLYSAPTSFLDSLTVSLPIFFLASFYSESSAAYYALAYKVAQAPLSVISAAISQVNMKKISSFINLNQSPLPYLKKMFWLLLVFSITPTLAIMILGPSIFPVIFGNEWIDAGNILAILMPSFALRFIVSTLSGTLPATGHVKLASIWQILFLVATCLMFYFSLHTLNSVEIFFAMAVVDVLAYTIYAGFIFFSAKYPKFAA